MSDMVPMQYTQPVQAPRSSGHPIMDAFLAGVSAIQVEIPRNATPEQIIYHAHAQLKLSQTPQATVTQDMFVKAMDAVIDDTAAQRQMFIN